MRITDKKNPVLSFERIEGNDLYYKLLVLAIKNLFKEV